MTAEIKALFQTNIRLLEIMDKAVLFFREQNYQDALEYMPEVSEKMKTVIDGIILEKEYFELVSIESLMEMLEGIVEATRAQDYVLLADLLELQLSSLLCNVQELIMNKEQQVVFSEEVYRTQCKALSKLLGKESPLDTPLNPAELVEQGYRVEFTSVGLMTAAVKTDRGPIYLHTNHKVSMEAFLLARSWQQEGVTTYLVKGFGLGYHVAELLQQNPEAKVEVYESNAQILKLACAFAPVQELFSNNRLAVHYDADGALWKARVEGDLTGKKICLHMPSIQAESALY